MINFHQIGLKQDHGYRTNTTLKDIEWMFVNRNQWKLIHSQGMAGLANSQCGGWITTPTCLCLCIFHLGWLGHVSSSL